MAEIVNLRQARKRKAREAEQAQASANRASFGRTKAEREQKTLSEARAERQLDGHKRESADETR